MPNELRNFLALTYDELEDLNLEAKEQRRNRVPTGKIQEKRLKYLTDEKRIMAVTVLFSDLEGRLHMLDDFSMAKYYDFDSNYLIEKEAGVRHYEVSSQAPPAPFRSAWASPLTLVEAR